MTMKLLAMMAVAGGSMFAQPRISVGVGIGGYGGGYYQQAPAYAYAPPCPNPYDILVNGYCVADYGYSRPFYGGFRVAPRFDDRRGFTRGFEQDRNRGFEQSRSSGGQNRSQTPNRGGSNRPSGQNFSGQNSRQGSGNGFRGR
jgi:hypothetical protein